MLIEVVDVLVYIEAEADGYWADQSASTKISLKLSYWLLHFPLLCEQVQEKLVFVRREVEAKIYWIIELANRIITVRTKVCVKNSVHGGGGVSASVHAGIYPAPQERHPRQTPPRRDTPDRHPPPEQTPYPHPVHTGIDMATAADGTHPTGMHFCLNRF